MTTLWLELSEGGVNSSYFLHVSSYSFLEYINMNRISTLAKVIWINKHIDAKLIVNVDTICMVSFQILSNRIISNQIESGDIDDILLNLLNNNLKAGFLFLFFNRTVNALFFMRIYAKFLGYWNSLNHHIELISLSNNKFVLKLVKLPERVIVKWYNLYFKWEFLH